MIIEAEITIKTKVDTERYGDIFKNDTPKQIIEYLLHDGLNQYAKDVDPHVLYNGTSVRVTKVKKGRKDGISKSNQAR
jgi:hypothetical protein